MIMKQSLFSTPPLKFHNLFILTLLLITSLAFGQDSSADSLTRMLPGTSGIKRAALLNQLAEVTVEEFPEKAIAYASEALQLSRKVRSMEEEARSLTILGDAALLLNNFRDAITYYNHSSQLVMKFLGSESEDYICRIGDVGYCYLMLSQYEKALYYFTRAAELAEKAGNKEEMVDNFSNIGTIYVEWGDYGMAAEFFQKAMSIDKLSGDQDKLSTDFNNIGKMYELWGKFEQAVDYYKQALEVEQKSGRKHRIAIRLNNLGTAYKAWGKYDEALNYFQQALAIERSLGNLEKTGKRLHHIGLTYLAMGRPGQCKAYLDQALSIFEKMDLHDELARLYNSYGHYYNAAGNFPEAINALKKSQGMAQENRLRPLQISNLEALSQALEGTGQFSEALISYKQCVALKDSVFSKESDLRLSEFRARLENEKIRLENERLQYDATSRKQNNLVIGLGLILVLIILLAFVFILRLRARNARQAKELSDQEADKYRKDLEIKNNELAYNAMCIVRNNETISRMIEKMEAALNNGRSAEELESVLQNIRGMEADNTWKEFEVRFTQVHKEFYDKLNALYPDLTPNEKKLCAFLRLNMTTKDIASITRQSVHSINVARTRLRKKLKLANSEENLVNFFMKL